MIEVFSHIVGLNDESKEYFLDNISSLEFNIIDLDKITENILNEKGMNEIYDDLDQNPQKSKNIEKKCVIFGKKIFI